MASMFVPRKYEGIDSWELYSQKLEHYFKANGVSGDDERVAILLTVLSPSVYQVLRDSCYPELPRLKTYPELSEMLKIRYSFQALIFERRVKFYRATQGRTESTTDWLTRIVSLAAFCNFENQLDTMLRDNFVSGLTDRRIAYKLAKEISSATLGDLVDMAKTNVGPDFSELPVGVLIKIISLLTPRERLPLGDSCHKFENLIFKDKELLKNLDFSKKGRLMRLIQFQKYFNHPKAVHHILRVNARNVFCLTSGESLNNSIGRAINLVEVNLDGIPLKDIHQLGSFLQPLIHLEKLSINWPDDMRGDASACRQSVGRPFSQLVYLSVRLSCSSISLVIGAYISLCAKLLELRIKGATVTCGFERQDTSWNSEVKRLENLKIIQYNGRKALWVKKELSHLIPDPKRWTDFQQCGSVDAKGFYIEKDVEICEALMNSTRLMRFLNTAPPENFTLRWSLNPECLLGAVLRIIYDDVPEDQCWLTSFVKGKVHLLRVDDAKMLLRDPSYQISYLYINHELERSCDAHLLVSAFPNLSELVLSAITMDLDKYEEPQYRRCLKRRFGPEPENEDNSRNLDSSFEMLVENTPNLRHFSLNPEGLTIENWDLDALGLISGWQRLESLEMKGIPIEDGQFLIDIGKRCKNLRKLSLRDLPHEKAGCYEDELFKMLEHCRSLRDFTIEQFSVNQVALFTSLANNVELRRVCAKNPHRGHSGTNWISALENLIHTCPKLATIVCETSFEGKYDYDEVAPVLERMTEEELGRPDFEIEIICWIPDSKGTNFSLKVIGNVCGDSSESEILPLQ